MAMAEAEGEQSLTVPEANTLPGAETLSDSVSGVASMIPFSDEIMAGAATPFRAGYNALTGAPGDPSFTGRMGEAYDTEKGNLDARQEVATARSPIAHTIGQAGAIPLMPIKGGSLMGVAPRAAGAQIAARTGLQQRIATMMPAAPRTAGEATKAFGKRMGKGALAGAGWGTLYGAGEGGSVDNTFGQSMSKRGENAAYGVLVAMIL